jgi:hypothetical protein
VHALQRLADSCHGDERETCPILDSLAGETRKMPVGAD